MNPRRLFVASCIALVASAFSFVIRQDVLPAWGRSFDLNAKSLGDIGGMAFYGMAVAMAIGAFVCDSLGMKKMLVLAFFCHLAGTVGTLCTPYLMGLGLSPYIILCVSTFLVGSANGLVEIGINPLAATLFPSEKTHKLNILHAWWPGGMMLGGLLALAISSAARPRGRRRSRDRRGHGLGLAGQDRPHPGSDADLRRTLPLRAIPGHRARGFRHLDQRHADAGACGRCFCSGRSACF